MEKLKLLLQTHDRWSPLSDYVNRIEGFQESDFSICVENAKSLLESVAKEICESKEIQYSASDSTGKILKLAFMGLGYNDTTPVQQIGGALANIGQQMSEFRNEIGSVSHGKTLEELEFRNQAINKATLDFLLFSIDLVCSFLIELFESDNKPLDDEGSEIYFDDNTEFNDFWDEQYGEFTMGDYSYTASQILYGLDSLAYRIELNSFKQDRNETDN